MTRRTQAEWLSLFEVHQQSGLTAEAFCKARNINPKYFSTRKNKLLKQNSPFVQAFIADCSPSPISLCWRNTTVQFGSDISPDWVAKLIQALPA